MRSGLKISVVIPCHNEEEGICRVLDSMPDFIDEIIVVDNASSDRTGEYATARGARVIREERKGYGRAYKTGLVAATGDIIVTMDGDATYPRIAIAYLLDVLEEDQLDFISAWRVPVDWRDSFDYFLRYTGNRIFNFAIMLIYFRHIHDSQSGMWVFKRSVLEKVDVKSNGMPFSEELKVEVFNRKDLRCREVPIQFKYSQRAGEAKLSLWKDGVKNFFFLFGKRFRLNRDCGSIMKDK